MNNKLSILVLVFVCNMSCSLISQTSDQGVNYIEFNKDFLKDCESAFVISKKLEPTSEYNKLLSSYLYKSFIDNEKCNFEFDEIFPLASFKQMVVHIFQSSYFLDYNIYESKSRWKEKYSNLIHYCKNENVVYEIIDELLKNNNRLVVRSLWGKKLSKLKNLNKFIIDSNNVYDLSTIATIFHNSSSFDERDRVMKIIKANNIDIFNILEELFENENIDYFDYMEAIHGGM